MPNAELLRAPGGVTSGSASPLVVIDAFRAAATACHILARRPLSYFLVTDSSVAARLAACSTRPLLIGKPEIGAALVYDLPNSPSRVGQVEVEGCTVIHRTSAGATGVLRGGVVGPVFLAGFVNASATARAIAGTSPTLMPMGHEGVNPTLEDDLAADCIATRLAGGLFDLAAHLPALRAGPGRYFFGEDQLQYPRGDFDLCVALDAFDFPIRAERAGDYASLSRG